MAIYVKAFSLVLKTVSKPLAKQVKEAAKSHPFLRQLSIGVALKADSLYQTIMSPTPLNEPIISSGGRRMKIPKKPPVMTEDQALQAAGDFLAEAFVFGVAGGLVWWEQSKSAEKDLVKATNAKEEREQLTTMIAMQQRTLQDVTEVLKEFEQHRRETSAALEEMQRRARERDSRRWWGWAAAVS